MTTRTTRPHLLPPRLLALLCALATTALLLTSTASPSSALQPQGGVSAKQNPSKDYPTMPSHCATRKELIPPEPVVCKLNKFDTARPTVVLWGDSHAWMMIPALRAAARNIEVNLVATVMGSCPPMDNQVRDGEPTVACAKSNDMAIKFVRGLSQGGAGVRVLLNGSWQRYVHALRVGDKQSYVGQMAQRMKTDTPRLMKTLAGMGVEADVFAQVATVPLRKARCGAGETPYVCDLPLAKAIPEAERTASWLAGVVKDLPNRPTPIDVNGAFCEKRVCHGRVGQVRTWFDDLHLSATMSAKLRKYVRPTVLAAIARTAEPEPEPVPTDPTTPSPGCQLIIFC